MLLLFFKDFIYLFLERGREGEREREGEKHPCVVASCVSPTGDMASNPGMCPSLGIKPVTLWFAGQHSIHWATPTRAAVMLNKLLHVRSLKNKKIKHFILPSLILSSVVFLSLCRSKFLIRKRYWVLSNAFLCLSRW